MQAIDHDQFISLLRYHKVRPRLVRELRFVPGDIGDWSLREFIAVFDRAHDQGVLIIEEEAGQMVIPCTIQRRIVDATGRSKSITCDLCRTWQRGSNAARLTFVRPRDQHSITILCCGDLLCSLHVRTLTPQSVVSRTHLREDITDAGRIQRLQGALHKLQATLA